MILIFKMEKELENIIQRLSVPGLRNAKGSQWDSAMNLMESLIMETGNIPNIQAWKDENKRSYKNYSILYKGNRSKRIVIGAHYDTYENTPGADDNASSVAVLLCLAKSLKNYSVLPFDTELVFYACEEPPFFGTRSMGSFVHAQDCNIHNTQLMIALEMVGYFSDEPKSQNYPYSFFQYIYGNKGNYLMLVSNLQSAKQLFKINKILKKSSLNYKKFISPLKTWGMDWSDHRNYWNKNIPAIMITDTSLFRNPHYHQLTDTPETLDYVKMKNLVVDLLKIITQI